MCPVQWRPPARTSCRFPFLSCPPDQHIAIIEPPELHACIALHFPHQRGSSRPCMGADECPCHDLPLKVHAYTIALVYTPSARAWRAMIVDLGFNESELATTDYMGFMLKVGRERANDKRSNLIVKSQEILPQESDVLKAERIDVRPFLLKRWGIYDEAEHFRCRDDDQQLTLPFDGQGQGKPQAPTPSPANPSTQRNQA